MGPGGKEWFTRKTLRKERVYVTAALRNFMFKVTKFLVAAIALTCMIASPRSGTAQALQEIRIGSSVIGFSRLMSYFARDLKFFEREGLDAKTIYAQTNVVLAALTAGNFDYTNLSRYLCRRSDPEGNAAAFNRGNER